jgi:[acyl-carrier-protein] S-malonyltransferase
MSVEKAFVHVQLSARRDRLATRTTGEGHNQRLERFAAKRAIEGRDTLFDPTLAPRPAFMFAGQGTQYVGMGISFHDRFDYCRETFARASDLAGFDLALLCRRGPMSRLTKTSNLQIALTAVNICAHDYAVRELGLQPRVVMGHSVGEYAALYAAGVLSRDHALKATLERGKIMQEEAERAEGIMYAVVDIDDQVLNKVLRTEFGSQVTVACDNGPGQQIVSGERTATEAAASVLRQHGARTVKLAVSGAWHSALMEGGVARLTAALAALDFHVPCVPLVMNSTGAFEAYLDRIRRNLQIHITSPVLWAASVRRCRAAGMTSFVELGPKRVLTRLCQAILGDDPDIAYLAVEAPLQRPAVASADQIGQGLMGTAK